VRKNHFEREKIGSVDPTEGKRERKKKTAVLWVKKEKAWKKPKKGRRLVVEHEAGEVRTLLRGGGG